MGDVIILVTQILIMIQIWPIILNINLLVSLLMLIQQWVCLAFIRTDMWEKQLTFILGSHMDIQKII